MVVVVRKIVVEGDCGDFIVHCGVWMWKRGEGLSDMDVVVCGKLKVEASTVEVECLMRKE